MQYRGRFKTENLLIKPVLKFGWARQHLDDSTEQIANFSSAPSALINTEGPEQNRDSARIGLDLTIANTSETSNFYSSYDGDIASTHQNHKFTVGYKWNW